MALLSPALPHHPPPLPPDRPPPMKTWLPTTNGFDPFGVANSWRRSVGWRLRRFIAKAGEMQSSRVGGKVCSRLDAMTQPACSQVRSATVAVWKTAFRHPLEGCATAARTPKLQTSLEGSHNPASSGVDPDLVACPRPTPGSGPARRLCEPFRLVFSLGPHRWALPIATLWEPFRLLHHTECDGYYARRLRFWYFRRLRHWRRWMSGMAALDVRSLRML